MAVVLIKNLSGFSGAPEAEIAARIAAGRSGSFFYVAPTKRRVRSLQGEFLWGSRSGASGPFSIFTLETLAEAVHALLCPPKRLLQAQLQAALVQEAIRERASDLRYFTLRGPARRLPRGTLSRITNVITRLKEGGVYLSTLTREIGEGDESEQLKLRDIATIYEAYEALLGDRYIDPPGLFKEANFAWTRPGSGEAFRAAYPEVDFLAVTGFDEFSDPELTLLNYLSDTPGLGTVVSFDYHPDNENLFGHLRENYTKFLAMGFRQAGTPAAGIRPFHAHIARRLFAPAGEAEHATFDATAVVTACPATDRVREVELIARIIKTAVADTPGLGLADVCVCMPRPELYSAIFREVFEQAGIPANITDRFYLEESVLVTGIVSMFQIAQNNFRIEDIMRAATNPFLEISGSEGPIDAANLLRTASELRMVSGRKRWFDRIESRHKFLQRSHPADEGSGSRRAAAEDARLVKAAADITELDRLIGRLRQPMTTVQFRDAAVLLAADLGTGKRLAAAGASGAGAADAEREARAHAEFHRFMDDFPELLRTESPAAEAHPLSWYLERFRPLLSQLRFNVRQRFGEGVLVTSIDETRGLSFRVLVLAGLVDGEFPSVYEPEVFLTPRGRDRKERYHLHEQRYLFYQALSGCSDRLYLTWPVKQNDVDLNPSGFLEGLEAAVSIARFELNGDQPWAHTLVTPDDLLTRSVEEGGGPVDGAVDGPQRGGPPVDGPTVVGEEMLSHIRAAIVTENARRRDAGAETFRGILAPAALPQRAAARLGSFRNATYSVTQLETYGSCPFRFFADRVLNLRVTEEPEEGITPREMGRLLHEILYEFYADRRARGLPTVAGLDDDAFAVAVAGLRAIAAGKFDETVIDDVFWEISRETVLGSPGRRGTLEAMLAAERESGLSAVPSFFEVRFGKTGEDLKHSDPELFSDTPVPAGEIYLQGKIDRIDVAGDAFRVVDYKTGSVIPSKKEVDDGASLQLPLYLHCAEAIFRERGGREMTGGAGLYYHLKPAFDAPARIGSESFKRSLLDPERRFRLAPDEGALRAQVLRAVATADGYAERISRGEFPVEPRDPAKVCRSCDFRRMCRIRSRVSGGSDEAAGGGRGESENQEQ